MGKNNMALKNAELTTDPIQQAGQQLIQTALDMGGSNNVTVIVKIFLFSED
jgi:serine/threonine protein phosphatase PrpC